jgi:hypothetical protein
VAALEDDGRSPAWFAEVLPAWQADSATPTIVRVAAAATVRRRRRPGVAVVVRLSDM